MENEKSLKSPRTGIHHSVKAIIGFVFTFLMSTSLNAQLVNVWKLGNGAGLDFATAPPTALANSGLVSLEATSSICDYAGNLLFYTDGNTVKDRNDMIMPNGSGLSGGTSSTQTIIVPKPESCNLYYIIQTADHTQSGELRYSLVDMCLNNGMGDVVVNEKNVLLANLSSEKVTASLHANGTDYWVITHDLSSNVFRVFPVTASGIGAAVLSSVGSVHAGNCNIGPIKISSNGQRMAVLNTFCNLVELFDFDGATGVVSNPVDISALLPNNGNGYYGAEFSPNGAYLYLSRTWNSNHVIQFNLSTNAFIHIAPVVTGNYIYGGLQLGPDGRIYLARNATQWMGVIEAPNAPGLSCNFVLDGLLLASGTSCNSGIPNYIPSQLSTEIVVPVLPVDLGEDLSVSCGQSIQLILDGGDFCGATYTWQDGSTSRFLTVNQPGTYWVEVVADCSIGIDSLVIAEQFEPPAVTLVGPSQICAGQNITLQASGVSTYYWPPGQSLSGDPTSSTVSGIPSTTATYMVVGSTACGSDTAYHTVQVMDLPVVVAPPDTAMCWGNTVSLTALGNGQLQWSGATQSNTPSIVVSPDTTSMYLVTLTANGCTSLPDTTIVTVYPSNFGPIAPPDALICSGTSIALQALGSGSFQWSGGIASSQQTVVVEPQATTVYYVVVTQNGCTSAPDTVLVNVIDPPQGSINGPSSVCPGELFNLTASGGSQFTWINPAGALSSSVWVSAEANTTFVVLVSNGICAADTASIIVEVNAVQASFEMVQLPCSPEVQLINTSQGANSAMWLFGDGHWSWEYQPVHAYGLGDSFEITLVVNPNTACSDSIAHWITPLLADESDIYMPNAFTPNNDGVNDVLEVFGPVECHYNHLIIYNRWGVKIWETSDPAHDFWTAMQEYTYVQNETYVWRLEGPSGAKKGQVMVLR